MKLFYSALHKAIDHCPTKKIHIGASGRNGLGGRVGAVEDPAAEQEGPRNMKYMQPPLAGS